MATATRPVSRHRPTRVAAFARGAIEVAALGAFVLAVVLWADAILGRG